jgi:ABC-type thiamine transport system substrate-binding protein
MGIFLASPSQGGQYVNNWKKAIIVAVLVALLGISLVACGTTSTTTQTGSSQQALGNVTLYTADGHKQVIPMFERQYNAKVNIVTDGSGAVVNRLQIEKDNPQADVVVTLPPFVQQAEQAGLLTPFTSQADSHIAASRKDNQGEWYTFVDNYITLVYNPQTLKNPPQTYNDLTGSQFKDQVAYSSSTHKEPGISTYSSTVAKFSWPTVICSRTCRIKCREACHCNPFSSARLPVMLP